MWTSFKYGVQVWVCACVCFWFFRRFTFRRRRWRRSCPYLIPRRTLMFIGAFLSTRGSDHVYCAFSFPSCTAPRLSRRSRPLPLVSSERRRHGGVRFLGTFSLRGTHLNVPWFKVEHVELAFLFFFGQVLI